MARLYERTTKRATLCILTIFLISIQTNTYGQVEFLDPAIFEQWLDVQLQENGISEPLFEWPTIPSLSTQPSVESCENNLSCIFEGSVSSGNLADRQRLLTEIVLNQNTLDSAEILGNPEILGIFRQALTHPADFDIVPITEIDFSEMPWFNNSFQYYCVFNYVQMQPLDAGFWNIEELRAGRCGGRNGLGVIGVGAGREIQLTAISNSSIEVPSDNVNQIIQELTDQETLKTLLDEQAIERYSRFFEQQLDHFFNLFQLREQRLTTENENFASLLEARLNLIRFWNGQDIIEHNQEVLRIHRRTGHITFWIAVSAFAVGILLSIVQFVMAAIQQKKIKTDLNSVKIVRNQVPQILNSLATGAQSPTDTPTTLEAIKALEQSFEHEVEAEFNKVRLVMRTNALGVIILAISAVFFALYLIFVFPISFPSSEQISGANPTTTSQATSNQSD